MRQRHIKWIVNAKVDRVDAEKMHVTEVDEDGKPKKAHELPFKFSMMIPGLSRHCGGSRHRGLGQSAPVHYRRQTPAQSQIPQRFRRRRLHCHRALEQTPLPVGVPKTGYMIESMVTATALNMASLFAAKGRARGHVERHLPSRFRRFRRRLCGHAAKPAAQRQLGVSGRWVHVAKVAFEKYFLHKVRAGTTDPVRKNGDAAS